MSTIMSFLQQTGLLESILSVLSLLVGWVLLSIRSIIVKNTGVQISETLTLRLQRAADSAIRGVISQYALEGRPLDREAKAAIALEAANRVTEGYRGTLQQAGVVDSAEVLRMTEHRVAAMDLNPAEPDISFK